MRVRVAGRACVRASLPACMLSKTTLSRLLSNPHTLVNLTLLRLKLGMFVLVSQDTTSGVRTCVPMLCVHVE